MNPSERPLIREPRPLRTTRLFFDRPHILPPRFSPNPFSQLFPLRSFGAFNQLENLHVQNVEKLLRFMYFILNFFHLGRCCSRSKLLGIKIEKSQRKFPHGNNFILKLQVTPYISHIQMYLYLYTYI